MKRVLTFLLLIIAYMPSAAMALNESPVSLSHTFTGYTQDTETVTLNYTLHVVNSGSGPLHNVTLSNVSLFIPADEVKLYLGDIGAFSALDVSFSLVSPLPLPMTVGEVAGLPLFWSGDGVDAGGNFIEFPAESQGGAL